MYLPSFMLMYAISVHRCILLRIFTSFLLPEGTTSFAHPPLYDRDSVRAGFVQLGNKSIIIYLHFFMTYHSLT